MPPSRASWLEAERLLLTLMKSRDRASTVMIPAKAVFLTYAVPEMRGGKDQIAAVED